MNYRRLCKNGPEVSEIGFGGGPLRGLDWGPVDDETSVRTVHRALELGVTFFDTADAYGNGRSERVIGRALSGKREQVVLATKGGWWYVDGEARCDFSPLYLHRALDASLERLQTECVDLYQIHDPDEEALRRGEIFEFMEREKARGRIRFAGVSVDTVEQGLLCVESGQVDALQVYYNILDQKPDGELFGATRKAGVGVVVKTPLGRGLLTGKYSGDSKFEEGDFREDWKKEGRLQRILEQVQRVEELVEDRSPTLAQTALRFVLSHPAVSTAIPGAKRPEQAEANANASALGPLPEGDVRALKMLYKEMSGSASWI